MKFRRWGLVTGLLLLAIAPAATAGEGAEMADTEELAEDLYLLHCAGCHRPHGNGAPDIPGLHDDLGRIVQVDGGRDYLVRVPGAAQAPISDRELHLIINWVLYTFNADTLPENFEPLTLAEVTAARVRVLPDPLKYRAQLWRRVVATGLAP